MEKQKRVETMPSYLDPKDPRANWEPIDGVEVFYVTQEDCDYDEKANRNGMIYAGPGWYWWYCQPGCLPDSDPIGPFETHEKALDDARLQEGIDELA